MTDQVDPYRGHPNFRKPSAKTGAWCRFWAVVTVGLSEKDASWFWGGWVATGIFWMGVPLHFPPRGMDARIQIMLSITGLFWMLLSMPMHRFVKRLTGFKQRSGSFPLSLVIYYAAWSVLYFGAYCVVGGAS